MFGLPRQESLQTASTMLAQPGSAAFAPNPLSNGKARAMIQHNSSEWENLPVRYLLESDLSRCRHGSGKMWRAPRKRLEDLTNAWGTFQSLVRKSASASPPDWRMEIVTFAGSGTCLFALSLTVSCKSWESIRYGKPIATGVSGVRSYFSGFVCACRFNSVGSSRENSGLVHRDCFPSNSLEAINIELQGETACNVSYSSGFTSVSSHPENILPSRLPIEERSGLRMHSANPGR